MQYSFLGQSGIAISRLAFGAMTFGTEDMVPGVTNTIDAKTADTMVSMAIDAGINLFDTADLYTGGQSEEILGQVLEGKRQDVLISTKCGFPGSANLNNRGLSYHHIMSSIEASLKRLNTDYIDLFFFHIPDPYTPVEESLRALEDATRAGKIRYSGLSNHSAWMVQKALGLQKAAGYAPVQMTQMYYSLLGRDLDQEFVPFLKDSGTGLMVWSPLASGYLTGKYTGAEASGRRENFAFPPVDTEQGDKVVAVLREIADAKGVSPAEVALAWLLTRDYISSVIVGANNVDQLKTNLNAASVELSQEEAASLDEMTQQVPNYPAWMLPMGMNETLEQI